MTRIAGTARRAPRPGHLFAGCWLIGAAAAGCAVDEAQEVAAYRSVLDDGLPIIAIDDGAPLDEIGAMLLAARGNERLSIEGERYLRTLIDRRRAAAALLPTITLAPGYERFDGRSGTLDVPLTLGLAFSPIRDARRIDRAGALAAEARALLLAAQDALLIDVARVHLEVLRHERAVAVLERSLVVQHARIDDARARHEVGLIRLLDVALSEAQAARTAVDLTEAQNRVRTTRSLLALLTGARIDARPLHAGEDAPLFPVAPDAADALEVLTGIAGDRRPELLAADWAVAAAAEGVTAAFAQYHPRLSVNLSAFLSRESDPTDRDWTAFLSVTLPIFTAGLIEADVRESLSLLRTSVLERSLARREVSRDIEVAIENLRSSRVRAGRIEVQVASARQALELAEALYQTGLATNLERLDAEDRLLAAELALVNAALDQRVFTFDLERAAGILHRRLGLDREHWFAPDARPEDRSNLHAEAR